MVRRSRIPSDEDRKQFLEAARARARRSYRRELGDRDAYMAKAGKHARIDWQRRTRAERTRQARTKSLESLLHEPAAPDLIAVFDALEAAMNILSKLPERERTILNMMFIGSYTRTEVAQTLNVSPNTVTETRRTALDRLRETIR